MLLLLVLRRLGGARRTRLCLASFRFRGVSRTESRQTALAGFRHRMMTLGPLHLDSPEQLEPPPNHIDSHPFCYLRPPTNMALAKVPFALAKTSMLSALRPRALQARPSRFINGQRRLLNMQPTRRFLKMSVRRNITTSTIASRIC
jgi:hypothetical protein